MYNGGDIKIFAGSTGKSFVKRMCEYLGYEVKELKRERIMNFCLGDLREGTYREATTEEMEELHRQLKGDI